MDRIQKLLFSQLPTERTGTVYIGKNKLKPESNVRKMGQDKVEKKKKLSWKIEEDKHVQLGKMTCQHRR